MSRRNKWKTLDEIAKSEGVSKRTIHRWVDNGQIIRMERDYPLRNLYKRSEVQSDVHYEEPIDLLKPIRDEAFKRKAANFANTAIKSFIHEIQLLKTNLDITDDTTVDFKLKLDHPALCVTLGDTHIGKKTRYYNLDIAKEAITELWPDKILSLDLPYYDEIIVTLLGDMIDGEDIYSTQAHSIEVPAIDQLKLAAEWIYTALSRLAEWSEKPVRVYTCPGNHGRTSKTANTKTNWDNVLYDMLAVAQRFANTDNLYIYPSHEKFNTFQVKDKTCLITHYGTKHTGTPAMLIKNAGWLHTKKFDFLIHGHYHKLEFGSIYGKLIISNGSLVGQDDLAEKIGAYDPPRQAWILVTPDQEVNHMGFIHFDHADIQK